jgi:hypothetical protein
VSDRADLRDLFREEFADVLDVAARIRAHAPRIAIGRTSIPWAILAGVGAGFFASEIVRVGATLLLSGPRTTELRPPTGAELATIAGTAFALAVAWRAAGWLAAEGYLAFVALERLLRLPALVRTCADPNFAGAGSFFTDRAPPAVSCWRSGLSRSGARWPSRSFEARSSQEPPRTVRSRRPAD